MNARPLALAAVVWFVVGCSPSPPTADETRAALRAHADDIERIDGSLSSALAEHRILEAYSERDYRFMDDVGLRDRRRAAFRERVLPQIARETGVLALRLSLRRAVDPGDEAGSLGAAGGATRDRAGERVRVDDRRATGAVYRTDAGDQLRAIEVEWRLDAPVDVVAVLRVE